MRVLGLGSLLLFNALAQDAPLQLVSIAAGVTNPTDIQNAGDGAGRLFLVEQGGRIRIFAAGQLSATPFLDIRSKVLAGGERGLLGLAFPPGYSAKRYFYVNYTDLSGNTVVARYRVTTAANVADANSESVILRVAQPFANHKGGGLRFGPDGYLYIGMGDGGSAGDPQGNGQNKRARLGKMLRIDVESTSSGFAIPPDNPFVNDSSALPEIWAYGLRNPWRFSFDRETNDLWIADVGQNTYEEVNFQPAASGGGENYGWNSMEGRHCFTAACSTAGLTLPVWEYTHADGCSITGGFVYRGSASSTARGTYVYADYCNGKIWGLRREAGGWTNKLLLDSRLTITTFGEDEAGELYLANAGRGEILRVVFPADSRPSFSAASVVNAASGERGFVPGSAATIYGTGFKSTPGTVSASAIPLPTALERVRVLVSGRAAPLYAVANVNGAEQINLQVPFELAGAANADITVERDGQSSVPVTVPVAASAPGIFVMNGRDAIVVRNSDNSLATRDRPARRGEFVYFYTTGLGAVENAPPTGQAAPTAPLARALLPPVITLGGVPCEVLFAGLAPGFVGVFQLNVQMPAQAASGAQDLVVVSGGVSSRAATVHVE
jgi:uncharacterized protein (TIGR03437 family)